MMGPDCLVYVDGQLLADDYAPDTRRPGGPGEPALLSGLTVRWGRETTIDQPDPGTATMRLLDPPGGITFAQLLRVGAALRVESSGPAWSDVPPNADGATWSPNIYTYGTFDDPSFDYAASIRATPAPGCATRVTDTPYAGPGALRWAQTFPPQPAQWGWLWCCPAPIARPGDPPGGWDGIPRWGAASSRWALSVAYRSRLARSTLELLMMFDPDTQGRHARARYDKLPTTDTNAWALLEYEMASRGGNPELANSWPVVALEVLPYTWSEPVMAGITWSAAPYAWEQAGTAEIDSLSLRHDVDTQRAATVLVFAGRITDVSVQLEDGEPTIDLTAADIGAELGNRVIGDEPWPAETTDKRLARIVKLAGADVSVYLDPAAAPVLLSYLDVDARPVLELLQQLASSTDSVLWVGTHPSTGAYLRVDAARTRTPLFELRPGPDGLLVVAPAAGARVPQVSACDLLATPARFVQDVADVITVAAVGWLDQTKDDAGKPAPTERTATARADPALLAALGTRRLQLSTVLATEAGARTVAEGILARHASTDYRASGLLLRAGELPDAEMSLITRLLDGTARNGMALLLVDLPEWAPAGDAVPLYLEGGTYSYVGGEWALDLVVSAANASGAPLPWAGAGPTRWVDYSPTISWRSLIGVRPVTKLAP